MTKKARRKPVQKAPENSLERTRRETKIRLQREVRLEKQIAALSRQLQRLVQRRTRELAGLANFIEQQVGSGAAFDRDVKSEHDRMALAGR